MDQRNEYGVYVIFSEHVYDWDTMHEAIVECINTETPETDILMLRKCLDNSKDVEDTMRWHLCMRKELLQNLRENGKQRGLSVYIYRANQKQIGLGKTYAFYIPCETGEKKELVKQVFSRLEGKFVRPGSYQIHEPKPHQNGEVRKYLLVSFEKKGEYFPRPFIRTLRALLNDMYIAPGVKLDVKWCSHRVLSDVVGGATK